MRFYLIIFILAASVISVIAALDNYTRTTDGKFIISNGLVSAQGYTIGTNTVTNWVDVASSNVANWAHYPAIKDVDINNKKLDNVTEINLGGESRTNWPISGGGTASQITNDSIVVGATVMDALNALKSGTLFIVENGNTSILYHVTSGNWTNKIGEFYSSP